MTAIVFVGFVCGCLEIGGSFLGVDVQRVQEFSFKSRGIPKIEMTSVYLRKF